MTDETEEKGLGYMTEERWSELQNQLYEIGVLKEKEDITNAFTTKFLLEE